MLHKNLFMSKEKAMKRLKNDNRESKNELLENLEGFFDSIIIMSLNVCVTCKKSHFEV